MVVAQTQNSNIKDPPLQWLNNIQLLDKDVHSISNLKIIVDVSPLLKYNVFI